MMEEYDILTIYNFYNDLGKQIDIFDVDINVDGILLCSDGLTNMLTTEQIEKVLSEDLSVEDCVKKIVRKCNMRGGKDNISIAYLDKKSGWEE